MNTKLINHEKYWLFVEIRENYRISPDEWYVRDYKGIQLVKATSSGFGTWEIIIAYLPKDNAPILEGVSLLPELPKQEEDVEQLSKSYLKKHYYGISEDIALGIDVIDVFTAGYKAASKNKWSDEDMRRMYDLSCGNIGLGLLEDKTKDNDRFNSFIQSLSPVTLPIDFKPEYENEYEGDSGYFGSDAIVGKHLKTVKNESGIEVLQGEWIYQQ